MGFESPLSHPPQPFGLWFGCFVFDASDTVSLRTVNRQCSSSLQAVADVAAAIKVGYYDIGEDNWIEFKYPKRKKRKVITLLNFVS